MKNLPTKKANKKPYKNKNKKSLQIPMNWTPIKVTKLPIPYSEN
jgi:hypothetical protein